MAIYVKERFYSMPFKCINTNDPNLQLCMPDSTVEKGTGPFFTGKTVSVVHHMGVQFV